MRTSFDQNQHQYDTQRRLLDRDHFNQDTRTQKIKQGEITGENFDINEMEKGMPVRSVSNKYFDNTNHNPHLDFDIYDNPEISKTNISYFDSPNINFSNINENENKLLLPIPNHETKFSNASNIFTFDFLLKFTQNLKQKKTIILSPINLYQIFSAIYVCSKNKTEIDLRQYFSFDDKQEIYDILYKINNILSFKQKNIICINASTTLNDNYTNLLNNIVSIVKIKNYDEQSTIINSIAKNISSNQIINPMSNSILKNSSLLLFDLSYIKIIWNSAKFSITQDKFYNSTNIKKIITMTATDTVCQYYEDSKNQIIELDINQNNFSFGIVLPKKIYDDPIITVEQFSNYTSQLMKCKINIKMPKFKIANKFKIENLFKKYGLVCDVDISELILSNKQNFKITDIMHNAAIVVDESNYNNNDNAKKVNASFNANHPFLYYVKYTPLNLILFIGQYY